MLSFARLSALGASLAHKVIQAATAAAVIREMIFVKNGRTIFSGNEQDAPESLRTAYKEVREKMDATFARTQRDFQELDEAMDRLFAAAAQEGADIHAPEFQKKKTKRRKRSDE